MASIWYQKKTDHIIPMSPVRDGDLNQSTFCVIFPKLTGLKFDMFGGSGPMSGSISW